MMETSESVNRANGGMHYADAVYRKHAPSANYVKYIVKLMNQNLFAGETVLISYPIKNKIRINYKGEYFMLLSLGWVESFRKMKATALEGYIIYQLKQKRIGFERSSHYYRSWILEENSQLIR
jgi:hypothetical protein